MALTLVEKIATRFAVGLPPGAMARSGEFITVRPMHIMTHDNTGAVIPKFRSIGAAHVHDPSQPVFAIDHDIQNRSPKNLAKYRNIQSFAAEHGIDHFGPGTGISHQVMVEQGYVTPGSLVVGSDSHSNLYGALSALGTPVVRTDAAVIWATGKTWWQVPPVVRVTLRGSLRPGVTGKDVIITLCGLFHDDEVLNCAVEFCGDGVACLTMDQRMSVANMTTEWGALAGVFPFDGILRDYLVARADVLARAGTPRFSGDDVNAWFADPLRPDMDAAYHARIEMDLGGVAPHVSGPDGVKTMTSLVEMETRRVPVQRAYLLSCVNGRIEDIESAAAIVRGHHVAPGVHFYVAAASAEIERSARASGAWEALVAAGAETLPPGCGPCIGLGEGTIEAGETGISATNRNFRGRMGSREAHVYLGSPAVVAASALAGYIRAPWPCENTTPRYTVHRAPRKTDAPRKVDIIDGFPARIEARVLYLPADDLNTDGIYAGKWTYQDDLSREKMASVVFDNYDERFGEAYMPGDVIVGGKNFGTGSSREQAATALKYRGVPCVVASSFSATYKRNAFNNGLPVIECSALVEYLAAKPRQRGQKCIPGSGIAIDFAASRVEYEGCTFRFAPLGRVPQELIAAGGAEADARLRLHRA